MTPDHIDHLINIYLDNITSPHAAGWGGDGIMSKMIEFGGEIPRSTGNVISNLSMCNAIQGLQEAHPDFPKMSAIVRFLYCDRSTRPIITALLAHNYYRGLMPVPIDPVSDTPIEGVPEKVFDNRTRASLISQSLEDYTDNVKAGRRWVGKLWEEWV